MAYRDCPCLNCKDRSHGSKRVACQTGCEKYLSWKAKEEERKNHGLITQMQEKRS